MQSQFITTAGTWVNNPDGVIDSNQILNHTHNFNIVVDSGGGLPIGAFTWWFGLISKIPDGWLVLSGQTFDKTSYSQLFNILGSNKLPNVLNYYKGYLYGLPTFNNNYIIPENTQTIKYNGKYYNINTWGNPKYFILNQDQLIDSFQINYFERQSNGTYQTKYFRLNADYYRSTESVIINNKTFQPTHIESTITGYLYLKNGNSDPKYFILQANQLANQFSNKINYFERQSNGTYSKKNFNLNADYYRVNKESVVINNITYPSTYTSEDGEIGYLYATAASKKDIPTTQYQIVTKNDTGITYYVTSWSNLKYIIFDPDPGSNSLPAYLNANTYCSYFTQNNGYYTKTYGSIGSNTLYHILSNWIISNKNYNTQIWDGKGRFIRANYTPKIQQDDTVGPGVVTNVTADTSKGYDAKVDAYPVQSISVTKSANKQTRPINISAIPIIKAK